MVPGHVSCSSLCTQQLGSRSLKESLNQLMISPKKLNKWQSSAQAVKKKKIRSIPFYETQVPTSTVWAKPPLWASWFLFFRKGRQAAIWFTNTGTFLFGILATFTFNYYIFMISRFILAMVSSLAAFSFHCSISKVSPNCFVHLEDSHVITATWESFCGMWMPHFPEWKSLNQNTLLIRQKLSVLDSAWHTAHTSTSLKAGFCLLF